jgi:DNA-binding XRE family transcriptional regulator
MSRQAAQLSFIPRHKFRNEQTSCSAQLYTNRHKFRNEQTSCSTQQGVIPALFYWDQAPHLFFASCAIRLGLFVQGGKFRLRVHRRNAQRIREYAEAVEAGGERTYTVAEVFPEYIGKEQQIALRGLRHRENLTQRQLSELTGIPQRHISEMENGKRVIGKELAKVLARALHADYRMLL